MVIREIKETDIGVIMALENELFESPYSSVDYEFLILKDPLAYGAKVVENEEMIAYGFIQMIFENASLTTIAVRKQDQRRGIGKKLLLHLIEVAQNNDCQRMVLEVRVSNHRALSLYKKLGFGVNRRRPNYYGNEDGYEMILDWSEKNG